MRKYAPRLFLSLAVSAALLVSVACRAGDPVEPKDEYLSLPDPCRLLPEDNIRSVTGEGFPEVEFDPARDVRTTHRTESQDCSRTFTQAGSDPFPRRRVRVSITLYDNYSDKAGVHWARIGYRFQRDLFEDVSRTRVENLGDVAITWYEKDLFLGAHALFRDSNLVVQVVYSGMNATSGTSDQRYISPDEAKKGAVRLARVVDKNL